MSSKFYFRANPNIYEVNTIDWLWNLSQKAGQIIRLGQVPASEWDFWKERGMDYIWLMGVWQRSKFSRNVCQVSPQLLREFEKALPGFKDEEILGSPYAVQDYQPDPLIGSWEDLARTRQELNRRGMGLILDFVPNHTAVDHPWVSQHPEYYVVGSQDSYRNQIDAYFKTETRGQTYYIAHGRDPNFPPWTDTAQINFNNPATRAALINLVKRLAEVCDGLRCDMAMLAINSIFQRTWGALKTPAVEAEFWKEIIQYQPDLVYIAEAYWDTEWQLQQMGFDFVYDKRLYDRLRGANPADVFGHLKAEMAYQSKLVRFIENHDEMCSLETFGDPKSRAAAVLCSMLPGMKLYYNGQLKGLRTHLPVQLQHAKSEPEDLGIRNFYSKLLEAVNDDLAHSGFWKLKTVYPHADANSANIIAYTRLAGPRQKMVIVNLSSQPAQGRVVFEDIQENRNYIFKDLLSNEVSRNKGVWMVHPGLIFELAGYQYYLYEISPETN